MIKTEMLRKRLFSRFKYTLMVGLIALVVVGYCIFDLVISENDIFLIVFDYVLIAFAGMIFLFAAYMILLCSIDLSNLKKNQYETFVGSFTKFSRVYQDTRTPQLKSYSGQIFIDHETKKELPLDVTGAEPNKLYKIIYGKKSGLGIAIEKMK